MDFWTTILGKALTECGLFNVFTLFCLGAVCVQNVKIRAERESERKEVEKAREGERNKFLETLADANEINKDLTIAVETMKTSLLILGRRE